MSRSKIVAMMALIVFAMGIFLVGDTLAGEYVKGRIVFYNTKWEPINVGDEKDHIVGIWEGKGINSNMEGKTFGDGYLVYSVGLLDVNPKAESTANGYTILTDKDGDKIYCKWDQKGSSPQKWTYYKGTGKFEGIRGKGTASWVQSADPTLGYTPWEGEVELPR